MKFALVIAALCISVQAFGEGKSDAEKVRKAASVTRKEGVPIQSTAELCAELRAVRDLPTRVKKYCAAELAKTKAEQEKLDRDNAFKAKVKATIIASASKSDVKIPMAKMKWETMSCSENYEKNGFYCTVESTEKTKWSTGEGDEVGTEFDAPNGVRIEVDRNGNLKPGPYSITYDCLQCAA